MVATEARAPVRHVVPVPRQPPPLEQEALPVGRAVTAQRVAQLVDGDRAA